LFGGSKLDFGELIISPLAESDLPSILEIEYDSQPEPWSEKAFVEEINRSNSILLVARLSGGASGDVCSGSPPSKLAPAVLNPGGLIRGIESGSRNQAVIAGYICFWSVADEIQILNIAVRKTLRRKGIARKLIELAIQTGDRQKARIVALEVRKSNLSARKLYESFGFRTVGERPGYYGAQKESAILMELELRTN
jgi:[ribosomal protein S18]-alanine N-acetyltransferase